MFIFLDNNIGVEILRMEQPGVEAKPYAFVAARGENHEESRRLGNMLVALLNAGVEPEELLNWLKITKAN